VLPDISLLLVDDQVRRHRDPDGQGAGPAHQRRRFGRTCGRLRCYLRFEYEQYRQVNLELPRIGEEVGTPNGADTVIVGHRLKETVSVRYGDDQVLEWPLAGLSRSGPSKN
jgi:hypothetical protein